MLEATAPLSTESSTWTESINTSRQKWSHPKSRSHSLELAWKTTTQHTKDMPSQRGNSYTFDAKVSAASGFLTRECGKCMEMFVAEWSYALILLAAALQFLTALAVWAFAGTLQTSRCVHVHYKIFNMYSKAIAGASGTAMPHQIYLQVSTSVEVWGWGYPIFSNRARVQFTERCQIAKRRVSPLHGSTSRNLGFPVELQQCKKGHKATLSLLKKKLLYLLSFGHVFMFAQSSRDISLAREEGNATGKQLRRRYLVLETRTVGELRSAVNIKFKSSFRGNRIW